MVDDRAVDDGLAVVEECGAEPIVLGRGVPEYSGKLVLDESELGGKIIIWKLRSCRRVTYSEEDRDCVAKMSMT